MLDDPVTAQYTHTLTVTTGGEYTCTVSNTVLSTSANITWKGIHWRHKLHLVELFYPGASPPSDVTAVQDGPTSIRVSWTPSSDATGYRIHYTSSRGDSGSEDVSGGHSDSHTLTGLVKEDTYTISIMATSHALSSSPITVEITLSEEDPPI